MDQPQGNGSPQESQGGDAPKYVTEDQLNKAITARFTDFAKKSEKSLSELLGKFESSFTEKLTQVQAAPPPQGEKKAEDPESVGLRKQLAEMRSMMEAANAKAEAERAKARDTSLRQKLQEALQANGVDPKSTRAAIALLVSEEKRVRWDDETDALVFRDTDNQEVDLATGLKSWAKSEDAKIFLPPRGTQGSGNASGSGQSNRTSAPTTVQQPGDLGRMVLALAAGANPGLFGSGQ